MLDKIPKIKYSSIETSLSKCALDDDSNQSMQKLYESIIRSLNIGFSTMLHFLAAFENIDSTLWFKTYFLNGLISSNFDKEFNIFTQLGQIIKDRLMHNECVSKSQCPKAYLIHHSYFWLDSWQLLETLFKHCLVNCGDLADTDLNLIRVTLMFQPNETIHLFFQYTQELENEYTMQMSRHPHLIPHFKISCRFVLELMQAWEYQPYVMGFHKHIVKNMKTHDKHTTTPVLFNIHDIYDDLATFNMSSVPPSLDASSNVLPASNKITSTFASVTTTPSYHDPSLGNTPLIAYCSVGPYHNWYNAYQPDNVSPFVATVMCNNKPRKLCKACMTVGHDSGHCYLRGVKFVQKSSLSALMCLINIMVMLHQPALLCPYETLVHHCM